MTNRKNKINNNNCDNTHNNDNVNNNNTENTNNNKKNNMKKNEKKKNTANNTGRSHRRSRTWPRAAAMIALEFVKLLGQRTLLALARKASVPG